nr:MAG TPA: helix-turn-helix domain protein [Caudoviricetes sp.]
MKKGIFISEGSNKMTEQSRPIAGGSDTEMNAAAIFSHVSRLEAKCEQLMAILQDKETSCVDASRFYAVALTTEEVARLHGVSTARVRDYASRGLIELHPNSTDAKLLFRASTVLTLDFSKLKKEKSYLKRG